MLHGTKSTVGDFNIQGQAILTDNKVIYKVISTWNDIENPNPIYKEDVQFSSFFHWLYSPKDYEVHISWKEEYDVILNGN